jgi:hypothetical protein
MNVDVKFTGADATQERHPLVGLEDKHRARAVLGVADRDPTILNERNLDAAIVLAVGAPAPFSLRETCHVHRLLVSALRRFLEDEQGGRWSASWPPHCHADGTRSTDLLEVADFWR